MSLVWLEDDMTATRKKNTKLDIYDDSVLLFPLGKLGGYEAKGFCQADEHADSDRLVLMLAHAYNDLKDLFLWWEINREMAQFPPPGAIEKRFGQFCGMDNHIMRLMSGWLVETKVLLKTEKETINSAFFADTISKLEADRKSAWESLCLFAWSKPKDLPKDLQDLNTYLVKVRAHGTFHYYQTEPLATGFAKHFSDDSKPESKLAYATYGANLEESRFFFADAAITAMCSEMADDQLPKYNDALVSYLKKAHWSFRAIVKKYMAKRGFAYQTVE